MAIKIFINRYILQLNYMKILVTGAGGYIGTTLTEMLVQSGYEVTALDRFLFGNTLEDIDNVNKIKGDIRNLDTATFRNILRKVDVVMDLAALSNDPSGELDPVKTFSINHLGRFRVASLAKQEGVRKYILPSSCSIYGFNDEFVDELSEPNPLTTYARANLMIERDALALNSKDFEVIVFRLATVYGLSKRRMCFDLVVNDIVGQVFIKGFTTLTTGGKQWRPFIHVRDVCKGLIMAAENEKDLGGEIFNLGHDDQNFQIIDLAKRIFFAIGKEERYEWTGSPDTRSYKVRFDKVRKSLNFSPSWNIERGAKEIWEALKDSQISYTDLKTITVKWYKHLMQEGIDL